MRHKLGFIFLCVFFLLIGAFGVLAIRLWLVKKSITLFSPELSNFQFSPPSEAVVGQLTGVIGDVEKIPRDSTVSAQLRNGDTLLVGETLTTTSRSSVSLALGPSAVATMSALSQLAYSSGLPDNLLLVQTQGLISYANFGPSSLSLRIWHSLVTCDTGVLNVHLDYPVANVATLTVVSGEARVVMIDKTNQTQLLTLTAGQIVRVDDSERILTLLKPVPTKKTGRTR